MPLYLKNNNAIQSQLDIDGVDIPITYTVADMKEPDQRRSSSSKTITLKGTVNNMRVLKNVYNLTGANLDNQILQFTFDPRIRVECIYEDNGITLFDGLFQVLKATKSNNHFEFECVLFSNIANIYNKLKDINIGELGWSEYNHTLDKDIIRKAWDESVLINGVATSNFDNQKIPKGFGYIYSWFDLGYKYVGYSPARQRTNQLVVGVYFREILQKIMEYVGEDNYEFTLNNTELFKRLTLFFSGGEIPQLTQSEIDLREVDKTDKVELIREYPVEAGTLNIDYRQSMAVYTNAVSQDDLSQVLPATSQNRIIRVAKTGTYSLDLSGSLYFSLLESSGYIQSSNTAASNIEIVRNGAIVDIFSLGALGIQPDTAKQNIKKDYTFSNNYDLKEGDEIEIRLTFKGLYSKAANQDGETEIATLYIESKTLNQRVRLQAIEGVITDGSDIVISRYLPELKCADFLKSLMRMFNLYQIEEDDKIKFIPATDYYKSTLVADQDNWTDLLDEENPIEIEPPNRIKGKFYDMSFATEDDYYNERYREEFGVNYGDKRYEIANTWQEGVNKIELNFSQSVPVQLPDSGVVMPAIYKKDEAGIVSPYKGKKARVFIYNGLYGIDHAEVCSLHPSNGDYEFADTGFASYITTPTESWVYPSFHHTQNMVNPKFDITFERPRRVFYNEYGISNANLWSKYWEKFIEEITSSDAKILTAYFKLNRKIIKDLDFSKLKNIGGVLYRLNLVDEYLANEYLTVKCELIKVIKGDSFAASTILGNPVTHNGGGKDDGLIDGGLDDTLNGGYTHNGGRNDASGYTGATLGGGFEISKEL